jgi:hypothetical protein
MEVTPTEYATSVSSKQNQSKAKDNDKVNEAWNFGANLMTKYTDNNSVRYIVMGVMAVIMIVLISCACILHKRKAKHAQQTA